MKRAAKLSSLMFLLLLALGVTARPILPPGPTVGPEVYSRRRNTLMEKAGDAIIVLQGAEDYKTLVQFRQDNDFYYLTGLGDTSYAILVMDGKTKRTMLFLPPYDATYEKWFGHRLNPGKEATERTGITETYPNTDFDKMITDLIGNGHRPVY